MRLHVRHVVLVVVVVKKRKKNTPWVRVAGAHAIGAFQTLQLQLPLPSLALPQLGVWCQDRPTGRQAARQYKGREEEREKREGMSVCMCVASGLLARKQVETEECCDSGDGKNPPVGGSAGRGKKEGLLMESRTLIAGDLPLPRLALSCS